MLPVSVQVHKGAAMQGDGEAEVDEQASENSYSVEVDAPDE